MFKTLVSIIIPVYNGDNYLREAIDSALAQTYDNIEVIVVNDGSIDNTEEIAKSYGDKIKYFSKENGGVASALNLGLKEMKGEYFSWLSHDDVYLPQKIERQIDYLEKSENKNMILYSDHAIINEKSKVVKNVRRNHKILEKKQEYALLRGNVNGNTLLIPKKAFNEYGYFDEKLKTTQDYDMWNRMMQTYQFVHMPEVLAQYRVHQMQDSNKHPNSLVEGNTLWIRMMTELPNEAKERLEGNIENFYRKMVFFLKQTPYKEAMWFANKKANEIRLKNNKAEVDYSRAWHLPERSEMRSKIRFVFLSPMKFLKKYL